MTDTDLAILAIGIATFSLVVSVLTPIITPIIARSIRDRLELEERQRQVASLEKVNAHLKLMSEIEEREAARLAADPTSANATRTPGAPR